MGSRRRVARAGLAGALAGLAIATGATGLAACGDDPPSAADQRADQARHAAVDAGLGEEVADFLALTARGTQATYRVVYRTAQDQEVTVTQRPPDRRLDVEGANGTADATIAVGGVVYQCRRISETWQCGALPGEADEAPGPFDPEAVVETTEALRRARDAYDFMVETRSVAQVEASCLVTTLRPGAEATEGLGESGTLCLSPEGVPLLVERPGEQLSATGYRTSVADDAFELPGEVTPPPTVAGSVP